MSYSGLAADISTVLSPSSGTPITQTVREVQNTLLSKGFSVGSTGADGVWGPNTSAALAQAMQFAYATGTVSSSGGNITFSDSRDWTAIKGLPNSSVVLPATPPPAPPASHPATTTIPSSVTPTIAPSAPSTGINWTPWLIGGGVLLAGAGAWLMLSKPKKPSMSVKGRSVKKNTRRRTKRRKARRTRRTRSTSKRHRATTRVARRRGVRRNPRRSRRNSGARDVILDGYAYEYTGPRGGVFSSDDDDWETVMVSHRPGSVIGSRNIDGSRMAIVKADNGKTYAILWHMMENRA